MLGSGVIEPSALWLPTSSLGNAYQPISKIPTTTIIDLLASPAALEAEVEILVSITITLRIGKPYGYFAASVGSSVIELLLHRTNGPIKNSPSWYS